MPLALQPRTDASSPTNDAGLLAWSSSPYSEPRIWGRRYSTQNTRRGLQHQSSTQQWSWSSGTNNAGLGFPALVYETSTMSRCTGKERDTESGLDYFGARYYGNSMGRFMSPSIRRSTIYWNTCNFR